MDDIGGKPLHGWSCECAECIERESVAEATPPRCGCVPESPGKSDLE